MHHTGLDGPHPKLTHTPAAPAPPPGAYYAYLTLLSAGLLAVMLPTDLFPLLPAGSLDVLGVYLKRAVAAGMWLIGGSQRVSRAQRVVAAASSSNALLALRLASCCPAGWHAALLKAPRCRPQPSATLVPFRC